MALRTVLFAAASCVAFSLVSSALVAPDAAAAKAIKSVSKPKLSDASPQVGQAVKAKADTSTKPKAKITYQWMLDGKHVLGETKKTFTAQTEDIGKRLSVKVCYKKKGYASKCVTSKKSKKISPEPMVASPTDTVLAEVNKARAQARQCGATTFGPAEALLPDPETTSQVQGFVEEMARRKTWGFSYTADGITHNISEVVTRSVGMFTFYPSYATSNADLTVKSGIDKWLKGMLSDSHSCSTLMSSAVVGYGIGYADNKKSKYRHIVTIVFIEGSSTA